MKWDMRQCAPAQRHGAAGLLVQGIPCEQLLDVGHNVQRLHRGEILLHRDAVRIHQVLLEVPQHWARLDALDVRVDVVVGGAAVGAVRLAAVRGGARAVHVALGEERPPGTLTVGKLLDHLVGVGLLVGELVAREREDLKGERREVLVDPGQLLVV